MSKKISIYWKTFFPSQSERKMGAIPECLRGCHHCISWGKKGGNTGGFKTIRLLLQLICSPLMEQKFLSFVNGASQPILNSCVPAPLTEVIQFCLLYWPLNFACNSENSSSLFRRTDEWADLMELSVFAMFIKNQMTKNWRDFKHLWEDTSTKVPEYLEKKSEIFLTK